MSELLLVPIVFACVLAYNLWRLNDAVRARKRMGKALNDFLGTDAPDEQKEIAYSFYQVSLYPWLLPAITLHMIFGRKPKKEPYDTAAAIRESDMFNRILFRGLIVMLKRAPIMSFVSILVLLVMAIVKAIKSKLYYSESIERFEDGIEKVAHKAVLRQPKF